MNAFVFRRPRAASSLFPEQDSLSTTFEIPVGQSSPIAAAPIQKSTISKPASRTLSRLMSVEDVNETMSNHFQTMLETGISAIKSEMEKQMDEWKQMLAGVESR